MPGSMWDNSSIIMGDQRGQNIGAGIQQAGQAFSRGVADYFKKKEEQQKQEATVQWLETSGAANNLFPQLAQVKDPAERKKIITAGIKGAGLENMVQVANLSAQQERQKREDEAKAQIDQARIAEMNAQAKQHLEAIASQQRETKAMGAAFDPMQEDQRSFYARGGPLMRDPAQRVPQTRDRTPAEMVAAYGRAGGRNPEMMTAMSNMQKPVKPVPGSAGYSKVAVPDVGEMVVDRATGEPVDSGKLIRPDRKSDEKALTAAEIQQIQALGQSRRDLDVLESAYAEMKDADWGGPIAGRVKAAAGMGANPNISRIENLVASATPNLARGVFREVGVLTDEDVKRYSRLLPNYTDTAAQRKQKLADLRSRLAQSTTETLSTLKAAGRDVTGLQDKLLGHEEKKSAPATANKFPEYTTPQEVETAIATGQLQRGAVVRVGGQLFRAQ